MSTADIREELESVEEVLCVDIERVKAHGENAIEVTATLHDGRTIIGTFTTDDKTSFGGVQFSSRKDIGSLMASKVRSVVAGTADLV